MPIKQLYIINVLVHKQNESYLKNKFNKKVHDGLTPLKKLNLKKKKYMDVVQIKNGFTSYYKHS